MRNLCSLFFAFIILGIQAKAQFKYNFSVLKAPYTELSGAISVNGTTMWDEDSYMVPIGFTFKFKDKNIDHLGIMGPTCFGDDTTNIINCFWAAITDYHDRGIHGSGSTSSPIRYATTGTFGSRIFKAEVANAGFYEEFQQFGTNNDFVNIQIWLYEGSNIVELRFGPSKISHAPEYFFANGKPAIGYLENWHWDSTYCEKSYILVGNPDSPTPMKDVISYTGLDSMPSDSTIYRFTPNATTIKIIADLEKLGIRNTICKNELIITNPKKEEYAYSITSIDGLLISLQGKSKEGLTKVILGSIPPGQYILKIFSATGETYCRFIKTSE